MTPDGRDVRALATLEEGKIVMVQKAKNEKQKSTKVNFLMLTCFPIKLLLVAVNS